MHCLSFPGETGGFMGLMMGASVMTLVEFIDLLMYKLILKGFEN